MSHEIVRSGGGSITQTLRAQFDAEQVALIQATVAKDCNPAELALFLETCARHQLDPFIKEIWAYKRKADGPVIIQASRDGLLSIANRHTGPSWAEVPGEFLGCQSNVVHEHDHFDVRFVEREDETVKVLVEHSPRSKEGKPIFGGVDGTGRGPMVGAWARVRRRGHDDVFFMAHRKEYDSGKQAWATHPHAMMQKAAESVALRKAFSISGLVGEGEITPDRATVTAPSGDEGNGEIRWPDDADLAETLKGLFRQLGYRRAKVRALVNPCESPEDFGVLLARLRREVEEAGHEEEPEVTEAEVVG